MVSSWLRYCKNHLVGSTIWIYMPYSPVSALLPQENAYRFHGLEKKLAAKFLAISKSGLTSSQCGGDCAKMVQDLPQLVQDKTKDTTHIYIIQKDTKSNLTQRYCTISVAHTLSQTVHIPKCYYHTVF